MGELRLLWLGADIHRGLDHLVIAVHRLVLRSAIVIYPILPSIHSYQY